MKKFATFTIEDPDGRERPIAIIAKDVKSYFEARVEKDGRSLTTIKMKDGETHIVLQTFEEVDKILNPEEVKHPVGFNQEAIIEPQEDPEYDEPETENKTLYPF